jgi:hypothetical protein
VKLEEAIFLIAQSPEGSAICAKPPFWRGAEAQICMLDSEGGVSCEVVAEGYKIFLDAEDVSHLLEDIEAKVASRETIAEFVIHYATMDAYPSWAQDLADK